jgi:signal transduction histidine kinase
MPALSLGHSFRPVPNSAAHRPLLVAALAFAAALAPVGAGAWLLSASESRQPAKGNESPLRQPWFLLACGLPLACALAWAAARQTQRRAQLESAIAQRTAELRTAHHRLAEALSHERELNAMKTNFISMVTHELRTPLSVVQSSTDILSRYLDRLPDGKRAEHFRAIAHAVTRITDLSDEVLLFSRFEAQRMQLKATPLDLAAFCGALARELLSATSEKCPITVACDADLPPASADERLLRHVLVNLLGNAVKYSASGAPVSFMVARQAERATFTIADHGIGIAAADQERLFQTFHRGANVEHLPGTGLGLVIVKRCVELHGGTISLDSAEGRGTTVTVSLPLFPELKS